MTSHFASFTGSLRRVILLAQRAAVSAGRPLIEPQDLLIGLLRERDGEAAHELDALKLSLTSLPDVGPTKSGDVESPKADLSLAEMTKRVIEGTIWAARQPNGRVVGTLHLLRGLLVNDDDRDSYFFDSADANQASSRRFLLKRLELEAISQPLLTSAEYAVRPVRQQGIYDPDPRDVIGKWRRTFSRSFGLVRPSEDRTAVNQFSEYAHLVLIRARNEAAAQARQIEPEHLLTGLLKQPFGLAAEMLLAMAPDVADLREDARVASLPADYIGASRQTTNVLHHAAREAVADGYDCVGTAHLLLGLAINQTHVTASVMGDLGLIPDEIEEMVRGVLQRIRDVESE